MHTIDLYIQDCEDSLDLSVVSDKIILAGGEVLYKTLSGSKFSEMGVFTVYCESPISLRNRLNQIGLLNRVCNPEVFTSSVPSGRGLPKPRFRTA